jgi:hypothetical protein
MSENYVQNYSFWTVKNEPEYQPDSVLLKF